MDIFLGCSDRARALILAIMGLWLYQAALSQSLGSLSTHQKSLCEGRSYRHTPDLDVLLTYCFAASRDFLPVSGLGSYFEFASPSKYAGV